MARASPFRGVGLWERLRFFSPGNPGDSFQARGYLPARHSRGPQGLELRARARSANESERWASAGSAAPGRVRGLPVGGRGGGGAGPRAGPLGPARGSRAGGLVLFGRAGPRAAGLARRGRGLGGGGAAGAGACAAGVCAVYL